MFVSIWFLCYKYQVWPSEAQLWWESHTKLWLCPIKSWQYFSNTQKHVRTFISHKIKTGEQSITVFGHIKNMFEQIRPECGLFWSTYLPYLTLLWHNQRRVLRWTNTEDCERWKFMAFMEHNQLWIVYVWFLGMVSWWNWVKFYINRHGASGTHTSMFVPISKCICKLAYFFSLKNRLLKKLLSEILLLSAILSADELNFFFAKFKEIIVRSRKEVYRKEVITPI